MIKIYQYVSNPVCAPYRLEYPGKLLNQRQHIKVTQFAKFDAQTYHSVVNQADILIVQRLPMSSGARKMFTHLNKLGKLIIFEIDDDLMHLDPNSYFAKQAPPDYGIRIKNSILASQAVQCSTLTLADEISKFHPEVTVLENQLERVPAFVDKRFNNRPTIIGYAAGEHHWLDWKTIQDAYNQVISELESSGYHLETWIIGDKTIFESINSKNKKFFPLLSRQRYLALLKLMDISIMPLADNEFNRCKSDVKFLESAAASAVVLASKVVYSNPIKHKQTGLLFSNGNEFKQYLKELVFNPELINILANNAHKYVSKHRLLQQHIKKWETIYRNWYRKREQLLKKTPGLDKKQ
ncbi:MAG: hypothetical protein ACE5HI_11740 [bacterium]